jgi:hypothetical protein
MKFLQTVLLWLVFSSKDPEAIALTMKAGLPFVISLLTVAAGLGHVQLPSDLITQLFDAVLQVVQTIAILVTGIATIVGLVRKIISTLDGSNAILNSL